MKTQTQTHETFIDRVLRQDTVAATNIAALEDNFDRTMKARGQVPDVDLTVMFVNVRRAIVRNALRRHRLANPEASASRRRGFSQGIVRHNAA